MDPEVVDLSRMDEFTYDTAESHTSKKSAEETTEVDSIQGQITAGPDSRGTEAGTEAGTRGDRQTVVSKSAAKLPTGLINKGNTCYANAILQALSTVREYYSVCPETPGFLASFCRVMRLLEKRREKGN
jgi:ubiquitin C-terminal hydrolase